MTSLISLGCTVKRPFGSAVNFVEQVHHPVGPNDGEGFASVMVSRGFE